MKVVDTTEDTSDFVSIDDADVNSSPKDDLSNDEKDAKSAVDDASGGNVTIPANV